MLKLGPQNALCPAAPSPSSVPVTFTLLPCAERAYKALPHRQFFCLVPERYPDSARARAHGVRLCGVEHTLLLFFSSRHFDLQSRCKIFCTTPCASFFVVALRRNTFRACGAFPFASSFVSGSIRVLDSNISSLPAHPGSELAEWVGVKEALCDTSFAEALSPQVGGIEAD
jgi:hypothetical protein